MADEKKFLDLNGVLYIINKLKGIFVEKEEGKGLSEKDFTKEYEIKLKDLKNYTHPTESGYKHIPAGGTTGQILVNNGDGSVAWANKEEAKIYEKATANTDGLMSKEHFTKVEGVEAKAQVNVIETISVNGTNQSVTNKGVNITVPTDNKNLTNGAGYQTKENVNSIVEGKGYQTASQVQATVNEAVANINKKKVVTSTKEMTDENTIYLMANAGSGNNIYDEYIVIDGKPEKVGTTEVDLTNYLQKSDLVEITNQEIDSLFE